MKYERVISPVTVSGLMDVVSGVREALGETVLVPYGAVYVKLGSGLNGGETSVWAIVRTAKAEKMRVVDAFMISVDWT